MTKAPVKGAPAEGVKLVKEVGRDVGVSWCALAGSLASGPLRRDTLS